MTNIVPLRPIAYTPADSEKILSHFDDIYRDLEIVSDAVKRMDLPDDVARRVMLLLSEARLAVFRANGIFIGRVEWGD
ncbi:hypothetical protein [Phreatobacter cathodiphilus]|uniref:Uncharacterized protein n=1 Tax=Phreatobacter cathodiphilus TaxID=1868589 RepID=A0A2S0NBG9_9HYPH|nr:hypothetical protein [Phreatobacter cathodiphilus]AVO45504.1 hypothetical protein C6569_10750 [Phreatobacter cathodiphilus]